MKNYLRGHEMWLPCDDHGTLPPGRAGHVYYIQNSNKGLQITHINMICSLNVCLNYKLIFVFKQLFAVHRKFHFHTLFVEGHTSHVTVHCGSLINILSIYYNHYVNICMLEYFSNAFYFRESFVCKLGLTYRAHSLFQLRNGWSDFIYEK